MALGISDPGRTGHLIAAPSMVFTARYAAQHVGVDHDAGSNTAFTRRGLDYLDELLDQRRSDFMQEN